MPTSPALGTGPRARFILVVLATALCVTLALAAVTPSKASAAGPDVLAPGQAVVYPTWFWGSTEFCATNDGLDAGMARIRAIVNVDNQEEDVFVPAGQTNCVRRWWWANPIRITNVSTDVLGTNTVLTVRTR